METRAPIAATPAPEADPKEYPDHVRLMLDMIALAFRTDTTRIATFMFGNAVSNVNFRFLEGVSGAHHDMSHHSNDADKLRQYQLINQWHVAQYAYLLGKLSEAKEAETNVLDQSVIIFGSALSDGNSHNPHKLPSFSRESGRTPHHRSIPQLRPDTPLANLWLSVLNAFGTPVDRFADSTGPSRRPRVTFYREIRITSRIFALLCPSNWLSTLVLLRIPSNSARTS